MSERPSSSSASSVRGGTALRVARHVVVSRGVEVVALQASPLLGAWFGGIDDPVRLALLFVGSLALTGQIFVFNDWADFERDGRTSVVTRAQIGAVSLGLGCAAIVALAFVGLLALLLGAAIALLGVLYSSSRHFGKHMPISATLNHLTGGVLHFLLAYTTFHTFDARGVAIGLFFALVFAAGHLNQEIRDETEDRVHQLRTSAVVFGVQPTFVASWLMFSCAYAVLGILASTGAVSRPLLVVALVAWIVQSVWSAQALRRGLGRDSALWLQRRYRLLMAFVGLAMLLL